MDNTQLAPGTGGDTIRTVDRTNDPSQIAAKTQVVQLDAGGEADESLVSKTNPLPVAVDVGQEILVTLRELLAVTKATHLAICNMTGNYIDPAIFME